MLTYTNSQSANSGYTSTTGPASGFASPTCGESSWSSQPNLWINRDTVAYRLSIGEAYAKYSTAAHELGHAMGLYHNKNSACVDVTIMEAATAVGWDRCHVYAPKAPDWNTINSLYD